MKNYRNYFENKKITVMGLGVLGRGIGDVKFLAECGADLIVTDLKKAEDLAESVQQLTLYKNIQFVLGEHRLEDFVNRDMILKSAGVPLDSIHIAEAKKNNIPVEMSSALFSRLAMKNGVTVIGVTGTRGKSTVTHLIYQILIKAFENKKHIFLGGNIKGVATLPFIKDVQSGDIAVLELDSWQLQGFGEDGISPHISVFTTFLPDHMNYYKGSMELYLNDKANIFKNQTENDFLIIGKQAEEAIMKVFRDKIESTVTVQDETDFPDSWNLKIPGVHNKYNAALAIEAVQKLSVSPDITKEVVESFTGVEGRLQFIKEVDGIKIYNDTTSTMPDATIAGLKAVSNHKNVILLMGGTDKLIDMSALLNEIPERTKSVVLLPGTGTDKIKEELQKLEVPTYFAETLSEALEKAISFASKNDVLLFSPAFASFGLFKNEYDRGEQFVKLVSKL